MIVIIACAAQLKGMNNESHKLMPPTTDKPVKKIIGISTGVNETFFFLIKISMKIFPQAKQIIEIRSHINNSKSILSFFLFYTLRQIAEMNLRCRP